MKLESNSRCVICLEEQSDPDRNDGLCTDCGIIADKYEALSEEECLEELNTWEYEGGNIPQKDDE